MLHHHELPFFCVDLFWGGPPAYHDFFTVGVELASEVKAEFLVETDSGEVGLDDAEVNFAAAGVFVSQAVEQEGEGGFAVALTLIAGVDEQPIQPETAAGKVLPEEAVHGEADEGGAVVDGHGPPAAGMIGFF